MFDEIFFSINQLLFRMKLSFKSIWLYTTSSRFYIKKKHIDRLIEKESKSENLVSQRRKDGRAQCSRRGCKEEGGKKNPHEELKAKQFFKAQCIFQEMSDALSSNSTGFCGWRVDLFVTLYALAFPIYMASAHYREIWTFLAHIALSLLLYTTLSLSLSSVGVPPRMQVCH